MSKGKAQSSVELLVILTVLFFIIAGVMVLIGKMTVDLREDQKQDSVDSFAESIISEFENVQSIKGGFYREFEIPPYLVEDYNVTIINSTIILTPKVFDQEFATPVEYYIPGSVVPKIEYKNNSYGEETLYVIMEKEYTQTSDQFINIVPINSSVPEVSWGSFYYSNTSSCLAGDFKIIGYDGSSFSHAEVNYNNVYTYSLCIDSSYVVSTNCMGDSYNERLFYLGDTSNSHIWLDNSTAYPASYSWKPVCLGTSSPIDVQYQIDFPSLDYACAGSIFSQDLAAGFTFYPNCAINLNVSREDTRVWIKLG